MTSIPYALPGTSLFPQVEPPASYWARCPVPCAVSREDIETAVGTALPPFPTSPAVVNGEIMELQTLFNKRNDPLPTGYLSRFLTDTAYTRQPPAGAVLNGCPPCGPAVRTGGELARLFEAETPGLWHRHVLNVLFDPTVAGGLGQRLSPPRQALIWAALDVAISSALQAAWHYKWLGVSGIRYRRRPKEYAPGLNVLYDF